MTTADTHASSQPRINTTARVASAPTGGEKHVIAPPLKDFTTGAAAERSAPGRNDAAQRGREAESTNRDGDNRTKCQGSRYLPLLNCQEQGELCAVN